MGGAVRARETWTAPVSGHAGIAPHRHDGTGAGKRAAAQRTGTGAAGAGRVTGDAPAFMGGQWQNDTPTLRIPYYRPLDPLQPGFLPGRAEQHLAGQVFSGLTRFDRDSQYPCGDLAHHWEVSADGLRWDFYIRSTLHWHNGDAVDTAQLHERLERLLTLPALSKLFISVARSEVTHPQCLTFLLHRPDYWLAHRLASYCSGLAHPDLPLIGTGPFRLALFTPELVRLESHDHYHLSHPLLKAIEF